MKKLYVIMLGLALATPAISYGAGGVAGSAHDMSATTNTMYAWNTRKGICSPCHSAHNTDAAQLVPLWNHKTSTGPFTPYTSPTMNASVGSPSGASLACLSCHDGTVGINEFISGTSGTNGVIYIDPSAQISPNLHTTHPVSFLYDAALANADGQLENPTTYKIGDAKTRLTVTRAPVPTTAETGSVITGKTIDEALLVDHQMQCVSCHDPHKMTGWSPSSGIMIKITGSDADGRGSLICRTCHVK